MPGPVPRYIMHTFIYICLYLYVYVCLYVYMYMYVCLYLCLYLYLCLCLHLSVHIYPSVSLSSYSPLGGGMLLPQQADRETVLGCGMTSFLASTDGVPFSPLHLTTTVRLSSSSQFSQLQFIIQKMKVITYPTGAF